MDLNNGNITIGQLLAYPPARALLTHQFPKLVHHPMARLAQGMTLNQAIKMAGDALPELQKQAILAKLKTL